MLEGRERAVHVRSIGARLLDVGALGLELGDVVARGEGLVTGAAHHDAAHGVVGGERGDRFAQAPPHGSGERVQLLGAIEHDGGDGPVALEQNGVGHASSSSVGDAGTSVVAGQAQAARTS